MYDRASSPVTVPSPMVNDNGGRADMLFREGRGPVRTRAEIPLVTNTILDQKLMHLRSPYLSRLAVHPL